MLRITVNSETVDKKHYAQVLLCFFVLLFVLTLGAGKCWAAVLTISGPDDYMSLGQYSATGGSGVYSWTYAAGANCTGAVTVKDSNSSNATKLVRNNNNGRWWAISQDSWWAGQQPPLGPFTIIETLSRKIIIGLSCGFEGDFPYGTSSFLPNCYPTPAYPNWQVYLRYRYSYEWRCTDQAKIECVDADVDGHYAINTNCPRSDDPDDNDASAYPDAPELCGDFKDNNSNGKIDEECGNSCPINRPSLNISMASVANIANGALIHTQELFSSRGAQLPVRFDLAYSSLNVFTGSLGTGWHHSFEVFLESQKDKVFLRNSDGGIVAYTLSGIAYISPQGDSSILVKNADLTFTITYRSGLKQNFDSSGKLTSIVDRYNNTLTLDYVSGDLTTITDSAQHLTTLSYDTAITPHRLTSVTAPDLSVYTFQYQDSHLRKVINPVTDEGEQAGYWEYTYNSSGQLQTKKDPEANVTRYDYHPDKRIKSAIDPEGVMESAGHTRTIDYQSGVTTFTEKDGGVWSYVYNTSATLLTNKTDPSGSMASYFYYPAGWLKAETLPHDGTTRLTTFYTYDQYGNLLTRTDPVDISSYTPAIDPETVDVATLATRTPPIPTAISYSYDYANFDQTTAITDNRGTTPTTTSYQYYPENGLLVTKAIDPANNISYIKRNPNGTIKELIDANARTTAYSYSATGLPESITTPDNVTTRFLLYDGSGNPHEIRVKDSEAREVITTRDFDPMNRLRKITRKAANLPDNITRYGYDYNGNLNSVIDPEQHETKHQYRYDGQPSKTTDARLKGTVFTYGGTGCSSCGGGSDKLTSLTDALTRTTSFQYDTLGRLTLETDPMNKKIRYTYYDSGKVKEKIDATTLPEQVLITYYYDTNDHLTKKRYLDTTEETFSYDPKGNLATATNQNIGYTFTYYDNGWLKSVTDNSGRAITYDLYDNIGQRKQVTILPTTPDQRIVSYGYDSANRLSTISSTAGTFTFGYDALSRRNSIVYPNQTTTGYGYDDLNRLTSLTHSANATAFLTYGYTHDQAGNRKTRTGTAPESYTYDELYRLKEATTAQGIEKYSYDDVGNRTTGPGPKDIRYDYDDANRMTKGKLFDYSYDNMGNQTVRNIPNASDKSWEMTWDAENRLTKMERTRGTTEKRTVTFKYDPLGRRIEKKATTTKNGTTKTVTYSYLYDNEDIVLEAMTNDTATEKTFYTHGPGIDEPLALERNGSFYYYHADGLGSITAITDNNKTIVQSYGYDSFGMPKPQTSFRNSYQFTGREWDNETGLYFYRARYYDPIDGRFISKDPIGFEGGINVFAYVEANPVNYIDPYGLEQRMINSVGGVPIILDTTTSRVTVGPKDNYVDPVTQYMRGTVSAIKEPVGEVCKNVAQEKATRTIVEHAPASMKGLVSGSLFVLSLIADVLSPTEAMAPENIYDTFKK